MLPSAPTWPPEDAGVLLVCAAPVIASYFTYYVIRPEDARTTAS